MKKKLSLLKIVFVCLSIFFIISCGKKNKDENTIFVNMDREPRTIDPTLNSMGAVSTYIFHAFEGLTKKNMYNEVVPGVAREWDMSEDGLTYTFYLRTNAKWSDGKPVTAKDFEYGWSRAVDPKTGADYAYMLEIVQNAKYIMEGIKPIGSLGAKAINDYTFEVTLENPAPYFIDFISSTGVFMPIRKDIIEKYGDKWTLKPDTYVVNGPYEMTKRSIDKEIVFEINTNYWNIEEQVAKKIVFVLMDNLNTIVSAVKNSDIYFSGMMLSANEVETLSKDGFIVPNNILGNYYIEVNNTKDVLNNKEVRRALSLAIDRNYIVSNITKGGQRPAGAFVPYGFKDIIGDFRNNGGDYISVNEEDYLKNIEEAKRLLAKAGYQNGNNFPVFSIKTASGNFSILSEALQDMWKNNLNIDVTITVEDWASVFESLKNKNYDMALWGWAGDYNDPMTILDIMLSRSFVQHTGFQNKEFDDLIYLAKRSKDNKVRMKVMHEAEAIMMEEMPLIPLYYRVDSLMINPNLKGYVLDPLGRYKFNYAYMEEGK